MKRGATGYFWSLPIILLSLLTGCQQQRMRNVIRLQKIKPVKILNSIIYDVAAVLRVHGREHQCRK